jgi:hypothetical protein
MIARRPRAEGIPAQNRAGKTDLGGSVKPTRSMRTRPLRQCGPSGEILARSGQQCLAPAAALEDDPVMRALECLAALAIPLLLAGCRGSETLEREDPSQNPAAPVAATPPAAPASAAAAATATVVNPRLPGQPATPGTTNPAPASPDAGLPQDAGRADAAAAGGTGSTADKLKACADKCQPVLQGCLTPTFSADAGLQVKDPKACEAAFNACQAACKP